MVNNKQYNPFTDSSFWVAFVLGGGLTLPVLIFSNVPYSYYLPQVAFLIGWVGWIVFKKGEKWSLVVGFLMGLLLAALSFYPTIKLEEHRVEKEKAKIQEEWDRELENLMRDLDSKH